MRSGEDFVLASHQRRTREDVIEGGVEEPPFALRAALHFDQVQLGRPRILGLSPYGVKVPAGILGGDRPDCGAVRLRGRRLDQDALASGRVTVYVYPAIRARF